MLRHSFVNSGTLVGNASKLEYENRPARINKMTQVFFSILSPFSSNPRDTRRVSTWQFHEVFIYPVESNVDVF